MLSGLHLLLSYMCNFECDHCFVYSGPSSPGTFTLEQIRTVLAEASRIGTIEWIYFEGGEPFLFYPLMIEGIRLARSRGFKVGVVTNAYYAQTEEEAELWFAPLVELGISDLSISDDRFHFDSREDNPARRALAAAARMGLPVGSICIEGPTVQTDPASPAGRGKGKPVVGGGTLFRGRAVEKLSAGLPGAEWQSFSECPYEDLVHPSRLHLDAHGNVQLCQGLSMGNMWLTPLSELVKTYDVEMHPICAPLARGGPTRLAETYQVGHAKRYVDACHFCYSLRLSLLETFPEQLAPRQVYGLE